MRRFAPFLFCLFTIPLQGMIHTIDSFVELLPKVEQHDQHSLFIFDIDETLLMSRDVVALPCNAFAFEHAWDETFGDLPGSLRRDYLSIFWQQASLRAVEEEGVNFVNALQESEIPTLGLTAMGTGAYGVIESLAELRQRDLHSIGLSFSQSYSEHSPHTFSELEGEPLFDRGVLLTDGVNKAELLDVFLDLLKELPQRVVYIDDNRSNLLDVKHMLHARGIDCELYHYIGALKVEHEIDPQQVEEQFRLLRDEARWLSDDL